MEGYFVEIWNNYLNLLEINFVYLDEDDQDKLIWTKNGINGDYIAKKGYEVAIIEQCEGEKYWWWRCYS